MSSLEDLPVACTLAAGDGAERLRRWRALSAEGRPTARRRGHVLEVRYPAAAYDELSALAAAERECCSFVAWAVAREGGDAILRVSAAVDRADDVEAVAELFGAVTAEAAS